MATLFSGLFWTLPSRRGIPHVLSFCLRIHSSNSACILQQATKRCYDGSALSRCLRKNSSRTAGASSPPAGQDSAIRSLHTVESYFTLRKELRDMCFVQSPTWNEVLRECHDNSAHQGTRRTQDKASLHYYWPSMTHDVNEWVRRCPECQMSNNITAIPPPLQSIQTNGRWEVLGMDLVALPETSTGNRYLLTVTDLFTKYIFLRALRDKSAKSVCDAVLDLFHSLGPPQRIITDQGREFVNAAVIFALQQLGGLTRDEAEELLEIMFHTRRIKHV